MTKRYRAMYGNQPCTAHEEGDGRTLTVQLDKDPGFGSMLFTRIGRSQVELIEELPPLPPLTLEQRKRLGA